MNVAIVGSRGFTNRAVIESAVRRWMVLAPEGLTIISGGARGADSIGEAIADALAIPKRIHLPDWDRFGRSAGFRRNETIVNDADVVLAFFADGPLSSGTAHSVHLAEKAGKKVHVYHEGRWE
jgi:predicted Rossmann fold nucleotide-binding protein DprA/Smf involved in DNA uptake